MRIGKFKFKSIARIYIIVSVILGITAAVFLGVTLRDKISLAWQTDKLFEDFERGSANISDSAIKTYAANHPDVADAILIDEAGKIIGRTTDAIIPGNEVEFSSGGFYQKYGIWQIEGVEDVSFRAVGGGGRLGAGEADWFDGRDARIRNGRFDNDYAAFSTGKVYDCIIQRNAQDQKLLIVFDWQPMGGARSAFMLAAFTALLVIMGGWLLIALWVYKDAASKRCGGIIWGIIALFTHIFGLIAYLLYRHKRKICGSCDALQSKGNLYCSYCGHKLMETCEGCLGGVDEKDKYCRHCGKEIK